MKLSFAEDTALWPRTAAARIALALFALAVAAAPALLNGYLLSQVLFVAVLFIAGLGLQILLGFTGQVSLGHAAFLAIGAYASSWLAARGVDGLIAIPLAGLMAGAVGVLVSIPTLRMSGLYLVVATIAFGHIVEEVAARWSSVTGGNTGLTVPSLHLAGINFASPQRLYYVCVAFAVFAWWIGRNLLRTPLGRAMTAVRDSEVAARCMGVSVARTKAAAFGLSTFLCGVAGALYGHALGFISPEQFTIVLSLDLLILVLVGGLASLLGVLLGAIFIVMLPEAIRVITGLLMPGTGEVQGVRPLTSGAILIAVMMFEQRGLYGLWLRLRTWVAAAPLYRRGSLRAQRGLIRSERW